MLSRTCLACLLVSALAACVPAATTITTPDNTQSLPAVGRTVTSTQPPPILPSTPISTDLSPSQTSTFARTETLDSPLPTLAYPTASPTSLAQPDPQSGAIQFYTPGPLSKVTSPVNFYGYAVPGDNQQGLIELFGEDGSLLASEPLQLNTSYKWAFFSWRLSFEVRGAGELGRLSLSTRDQYGRLTAVQSVHLLLLPNGQDIINPPGSLAERCVLEFPTPGKHISGGIVSVSGEMKPYNDLPLIVELVTRDGTSLGTQLVPIAANQVGIYTRLRVDIPYEVRSSTPVLLTVRQSDDRIGGTMYLFSQEIFLNP